MKKRKLKRTKSQVSALAKASRPSPRRITVPMTRDVALDLDHSGVIYYPHDRSNCVGCIANGAVARLLDDARAELVRKIEEAFLEGTSNLGPNPIGLLRSRER